MPRYEYDAFISHASEDKVDLVTPLALELTRYGLKIWFDRFTLKIGDSLRESIEKGLATSRFGIVVLSHAFFARKWPPAELNGLFAREIAGDGMTVILPVWHNITRDDLLKYAPIQADKLAANSAAGIRSIAEDLVRVIRPEALVVETSRDDAAQANKRLIEQLEKKYPGYGFGSATGREAQLGKTLEMPGLIASQWREGERIDIFNKDPSLVSAKHPSVSVTFVGEGVKKVQEALRTGRAQVFLSNEFKNLKSTVPLAENLDANQIVSQEFRLIPKLPQPRPVQGRVIFGTGADAVVIPVMDLKGIRAGTDEVEIRADRRGLPFGMNIILPLRGGGGSTVNFDINLEGCNFRTIRQFLQAMAALRTAGLVTIINLDTEQILLRGGVELEASSVDSAAFLDFVSGVVRIEDKCGVALAWPKNFTDEDFNTLELLMSLVDGTPHDGQISFATSVMKSANEEHNMHVIGNLEAGIISVRAEPEQETVFTVFGTQVFKGFIRIVIDRAEILNPANAKARFLNASQGQVVTIPVESRSPWLIVARETTESFNDKEPTVPLAGNS